MGVQAIHEVPASFVGQQMDSVMADIGIDAVKTGMLANTAIIEVVAQKLKQYRVKKIVVDPVMISTTGHSLLHEEARTTLVKKLFPLAMVATPNLFEASILTGLKVRSLAEMKKAAIHIHALGPAHVVVKGGHSKGKAIDILYDGQRFYEMESPRIETKNTHGTGCTFASAIATLLARGESVPEAVRGAKTFVTLAIQSSIRLGKGSGPTNPFAYVLREMEKYHVIQKLKEAVEVLKKVEIGHLIPEISSNLGYGLPYAEGVEDIAAFPGRIIRIKEAITHVKDPEFGASQHIAKIILTAMKFNPEYCSAMNIRYSPENIARIKKKGFTIGRFDRKFEPKQSKEREGSSLEWGVAEVLRKSKRVPDFIWDEGDVGKEPMIRVLGKNPQEVVHKILRVR